jgi:hypothetical protein
MSTSPSLGYPAPSDRDFRIVPELEKYVVTTRTALAWRIHSHKAKTGKAYAPVFFSNAEGSRWDFQAQSSGASVVNVDGALCVGHTFTAALIEVFGKQWPTVLPPRGTAAASYLNQRVLTQDDITFKYATRLHIPAGRKLFDLTAAGALSSVGADAAITTTKEYASSREWSRWFFQCRNIDGLIYSSRPGGAQLRNYVLFNRPGLQGSLGGTAGKMRTLVDWDIKLTEACHELNVIVLPKSVPYAP